MELKDRRCVPCEGGIPPLTVDEQAALLPQVPGWRVEGVKLIRTFVWDSFVAAMAFIQRMANLAEAEGHHPDFCVHYSRVDVTLWTHAARGLTENDFILASKLDVIVS